MSILLIALLNVIITIWFARKKWYAVSVCYIFAFFVLMAFTFFTLDIAYVTDGLRELLGYERYEIIYYNVNLYSDLAYQPYLAVEVMSLIAALVISLTTIETLVRYCLQRASNRYARSTRFVPMRERPCRKPLFEKKYLSFCSMLC